MYNAVESKIPFWIITSFLSRSRTGKFATGHARTDMTDRNIPLSLQSEMGERFMTEKDSCSIDDTSD